MCNIERSITELPKESNGENKYCFADSEIEKLCDENKLLKQIQSEHNRLNKDNFSRINNLEEELKEVLLSNIELKRENERMSKFIVNQAIKNEI